jgi:SpoVK/Ycf46/Vps4 family AAA+-type ATPase
MSINEVYTKKVLEQSHSYYLKAEQYVKDDEIEGSLINYLLSLNSLYNFKSYLDSINELNPEDLAETIFRQELGNLSLEQISEISKKKEKSGDIQPFEKNIIDRINTDDEDINKEKFILMLNLIKKERGNISNNLSLLNYGENTQIEEVMKNIIGKVEILQQKLKKKKIEYSSDNKKNEADECDIKPEDITKHKILFEDIIGQKEAKEQLISGILNPILYPSLYPFFTKGILFWGPPGTGKTLIAKALVNELKKRSMNENVEMKILFFAPTGADMKGKYVGETEKNISKYFDCASKQANDCENEKTAFNVTNSKEGVLPKKTRILSVLFIDEIDAIAGSRADDASGLMTNSVNTLLQKMDGVKSNDNVIVIGATNYPWKLDSAVNRRFNTKVFLGTPETTNEISDIIKMHIVDYVEKIFKIKSIDDNVSNYVNKLSETKQKEKTKKLLGDKKETCDKEQIACFNNKICMNADDNLKYGDKATKNQKFNMYRNRFFPNFTDEKIKKYATKLSKSSYTQGDIKNIMRWVFKKMGEEAIDKPTSTFQLNKPIKSELAKYNNNPLDFENGGGDGSVIEFEMYNPSGENYQKKNLFRSGDVKDALLFTTAKAGEAPVEDQTGTTTDEAGNAPLEDQTKTNYKKHIVHIITKYYEAIKADIAKIAEFKNNPENELKDKIMGFFKDLEGTDDYLGKYHLYVEQHNVVKFIKKIYIEEIKKLYFKDETDTNTKIKFKDYHTKHWNLNKSSQDVESAISNFENYVNSKAFAKILNSLIDLMNTIKNKKVIGKYILVDDVIKTLIVTDLLGYTKEIVEENKTILNDWKNELMYQYWNERSMIRVIVHQETELSKSSDTEIYHITYKKDVYLRFNFSLKMYKDSPYTWNNKNYENREISINGKGKSTWYAKRAYYWKHGKYFYLPVAFLGETTFSLVDTMKICKEYLPEANTKNLLGTAAVLGLVAYFRNILGNVITLPLLKSIVTAFNPSVANATLNATAANATGAAAAAKATGLGISTMSFFTLVIFIVIIGVIYSWKNNKKDAFNIELPIPLAAVSSYENSKDKKPSMADSLGELFKDKKAEMKTHIEKYKELHGYRDNEYFENMVEDERLYNYIDSIICLDIVDDNDNTDERNCNSFIVPISESIGNLEEQKEKEKTQKEEEEEEKKKTHNNTNRLKRALARNIIIDKKRKNYNSSSVIIGLFKSVIDYNATATSKKITICNLYQLLDDSIKNYVTFGECYLGIIFPKDDSIIEKMTTHIEEFINVREKSKDYSNNQKSKKPYDDYKKCKFVKYKDEGETSQKGGSKCNDLIDTQENYSSSEFVSQKNFINLRFNIGYFNNAIDRDNFASAIAYSVEQSHLEIMKRYKTNASQVSPEELKSIK